MMTRSLTTQMRSTTFAGLLVAALCVMGLTTVAEAVNIGGVDFPDGAQSFADAVVDYNPVLEPDPNLGVTVPDARWREPADALGVPNYSPPAPGASVHNTGQFVSLGNGGSLTLRFVDNLLTGSNDSGLDLWIFEVGPEVEAMFVEISKTGSVWHSVGKVGGATAGVDIDAYGFTVNDKFALVRLTDDPALYPPQNQYDLYAGPDIDAVGAISSTPAVPEPATAGLLAVGGVLMLIRRVRRGR